MQWVIQDFVSRLNWLKDRELRGWKTRKKQSKTNKKTTTQPDLPLPLPKKPKARWHKPIWSTAEYNILLNKGQINMFWNLRCGEAPTLWHLPALVMPFVVYETNKGFQICPFGAGINTQGNSQGKMKTQRYYCKNIVLFGFSHHQFCQIPEDFHCPA